MHYISHITLTTGHVANHGRAVVSDAALAVVVPWLAEALTSLEPLPIPGVTGDFAALALQQAGALVVTVYGPQPDIGRREPLASFGVAVRSRQAGKLWDMLMQTQPGVIRGLQPPGVPWCAVVPYPALLAHGDALGWLGDFERCVAWAWVTRNPSIEASR